jgi:hypothetical protein
VSHTTLVVQGARVCECTTCLKHHVRVPAQGLCVIEIAGVAVVTSWQWSLQNAGFQLCGEGGSGAPGEQGMYDTLLHAPSAWRSA